MEGRAGLRPCIRQASPVPEIRACLDYTGRTRSRSRLSGAGGQSVHCVGIHGGLFPAGHQWHVVTDDLGDEFVYRFEALRSEVTWSYRFWRNFSVDLSLGYEFSRRHRLEDAAGDIISAHAADELMVSIGIRSGSAPLVLTHGAHL